MLLMTKEELAKFLFDMRGGKDEWADVSPTAVQPVYLEQAEKLLALLEPMGDKLYEKGFRDAVATAQYMTGFTDETAKAIYEDDGVPYPDGPY